MADEDVSAETPPENASYDIPMPEHLQEALRQGWDPAPPMPHPATTGVGPWAARRRAALSAKFPGRLIVVRAGELKVRANDTTYPFRADSAFTWLTTLVRPSVARASAR